MKKIIHVNMHIIKRNRKSGKEGYQEPPVTCKTYKSNTYGHEVIFHGQGRVVYQPHKPLSCGARLWIETSAPVTVIERFDDVTSIETEIA